MWSGSTLGNELTELHKEWEDGSTEVAKAANDCSILAELITEKEYLELGTEEAEEWMTFTIQRLKTATGKQIATEIQKSRMTEWWEDIKNEIREKQGVKAKKYG
jgi:putative hydrolase of HD superfamily